MLHFVNGIICTKLFCIAKLSITCAENGDDSKDNAKESKANKEEEETSSKESEPSLDLQSNTESPTPTNKIPEVSDEHQLPQSDSVRRFSAYGHNKDIEGEMEGSEQVDETPQLPHEMHSEEKSSEDVHSGINIFGDILQTAMEKDFSTSDSSSKVDDTSNQLSLENFFLNQNSHLRDDDYFADSLEEASDNVPLREGETLPMLENDKEKQEEHVMIVYGDTDNTSQEQDQLLDFEDDERFPMYQDIGDAYDSQMTLTESLNTDEIAFPFRENYDDDNIRSHLNEDPLNDDVITSPTESSNIYGNTFPLREDSDKYDSRNHLGDLNFDDRRSQDPNIHYDKVPLMKGIGIHDSSAYPREDLDIHDSRTHLGGELKLDNRRSSLIGGSDMANRRTYSMENPHNYERRPPLNIDTHVSRTYPRNDPNTDHIRNPMRGEISPDQRSPSSNNEEEKKLELMMAIINLLKSNQSQPQEENIFDPEEVEENVNFLKPIASEEHLPRDSETRIFPEFVSNTNVNSMIEKKKNILQDNAGPDLGEPLVPNYQERPSERRKPLHEDNTIFSGGWKGVSRGQPQDHHEHPLQKAPIVTTPTPRNRESSIVLEPFLGESEWRPLKLSPPSLIPMLPPSFHQHLDLADQDISESVQDEVFISDSRKSPSFQLESFSDRNGEVLQKLWDDDGDGDRNNILERRVADEEKHYFSLAYAQQPVLYPLEECIVRKASFNLIIDCLMGHFIEEQLNIDKSQQGPINNWQSIEEHEAIELAGGWKRLSNEEDPALATKKTLPSPLREKSDQEKTITDLVHQINSLNFDIPPQRHPTSAQHSVVDSHKQFLSDIEGDQYLENPPKDYRTHGGQGVMPGDQEGGAHPSFLPPGSVSTNAIKNIVISGFVNGGGQRVADALLGHQTSRPVNISSLIQKPLKLIPSTGRIRRMCNCTKLIISSNHSPTTRKHGPELGEYILMGEMAGKPVYRHVTGKYYLYYHPENEGNWLINTQPGLPFGGIQNSKVTCPTDPCSVIKCGFRAECQVKRGQAECVCRPFFKGNPFIRCYPPIREPCGCQHLTLDSDGPAKKHQRDKIGDYFLWGYYNHRPVYQHYSGLDFIYYHRNGVWGIGPKVGGRRAGLLNYSGSLCPYTVDEPWQYGTKDVKESKQFDTQVKLFCTD